MLVWGVLLQGHAIPYLTKQASHCPDRVTRLLFDLIIQDSAVPDEGEVTLAHLLAVNEWKEMNNVMKMK